MGTGGISLASARFSVTSALTVVGALLLLIPASASGATIPVAAGALNSSADGQCSLVEAIDNANADAATSADCAAGLGPDTIVLAERSTYTITQANNTFYGANGLPAIAGVILIDGNGSTITRDAAAPALRIFAVEPAGDLSIAETVLSNGLASGGNGGLAAIDDGGGGGGGAGLGGAILNRGRVTVTTSTLTGNVARGGNGGAAGPDQGLDEGGGGGGGGLGGNGGNGAQGGNDGDGGGGGGGFGGNGGNSTTAIGTGGGGGGGGTLNNGNDSAGGTGGTGGTQNGGKGGNANIDGDSGGVGGGGGGAGDEADGGDGGPGGGGGGSGEDDTAANINVGGRGGFGGGGGGGGEDSSGGDGGFGGGGGGSAPQGTAAAVTGIGGFGAGNGGTTIQSNGGGGGAGLGGAIFNDGAVLTVLNSTLSGNTAAGGAGGAPRPGVAGSEGQPGRGLGGAIFSRNGEVSVTEATIADNTGEVGGVYVRQDSSGSLTFSLQNSIVALSSPAPTIDCSVDAPASTASGITNLIQLSNGCAGVISNADPQLGALADNGGFTPTRLPAIGSPVVNAASAQACTSSDQRGDPRPAGPACDIGAVELAPDISRKLGLSYSTKKKAFKGKLKASVSECLSGKVKVFRKVKGKDPKVASGSVKATGKYKAKEKSPDPGKYYGQVKEKQVEEFTCLAAKSKSKKVG